MSTALSILGAIWGFFTDPASFLAGAGHWLISYVMPPQLQTWYLGTLGAPGSTWDGGQIYQDVFRVVQGPALMITGVAAAGRVVRATLDHRLAATQVIFDTVPRLIVGIAFIGVPGTHVSLGYTVIAFGVDCSIALAHTLFTLLLQASLLQGATVARGWLDLVIGALLGNAAGSVLVAAALIPLIVLVLYTLVLMILRTVMLGFCVATAPLCFASAVFDVNNRFFRWWVDLFIGVLAAPAVLSIAIALSLTLALNLAPISPPIGALMAVIVTCGGLWMAAKMVHALTWRHFGHGGAVAGFTAGVTTVLGPLHKVAEVGHLAGSLGGGRSAGGGRGGGSFAGAGSAGPALSGAVSVTAAHPLMPRPGPGGVATPSAPPDIASALGETGRGALRGAEGRFSQQALTAFARSQSGLIGSLTSDLPTGSLSAIDRASAAWSRSPAKLQHAFAEEFLVHWLSGSDGDDAPRAQLITPFGLPAQSTV